jgi:hypothetical protein
MRFLFLIALCLSFELKAADVFGRYSGVLRHEALKRDQLAKLDLIAAREEGGQLELVAVLTLHVGDFKSSEYVAYHFDKVRLNLVSGSLIFDQADQDVTVIVNKYSATEIEADFRSAFTGEISKLYLKKDGVKPKYPVLEPLWGEYRGQCKSKHSGLMTDTVVQLQTYRSSEGAGSVGNPFRSYRVRGQLAEKEQTGNCPLSNTSYCHWGMFTNGSYNFYKSQLNLTGPFRSLSCTTESSGLKCDDCTLLKRVSRENADPANFKPETEVSAFAQSVLSNPSLATPAASIQGEYVGYVYHEYLKVYQPASINLLTFQSPSTTGGSTELHMSAIATLFFGGFKSSETISYRFAERLYPNPLSAKNFLFRQAGRDVDAILQITSIGDGVIKGWRICFTERQTAHSSCGLKIL